VVVVGVVARVAAGVAAARVAAERVEVAEVV